jgi:hypothetical protein
MSGGSSAAPSVILRVASWRFFKSDGCFVIRLDD